jgi:hypothetical protein
MRSLAFFVIPFVLIGCGPDLDANKYVISNVQWQDLEEYTFNYNSDQLSSISVTDGTSIQYQYYTDSVQVKRVGATGITTRLTTLVYSGTKKLSKVYIRWRYGGQLYKDSILFNHNANQLQSISWKSINYQVAFTGENMTNISRNVAPIGNLDLTYDKVINPFKGIYWMDEFVSISLQGVPSIQFESIARFFSATNIVGTDGTILSAKLKQKYTYDYLYDILPKSANVERETGKAVTSNLIYIALIVYSKKAASTTP